MGFIFFVVVLGAIVFWLLRSSKDDSTTPYVSPYERGYQHGQQALAERVLQHIDEDGANLQSVRSLLEQERTKSVSTVVTPQQVARTEELLLEQSDATPADAPVDKEAQSVKNLNTLLFVASLLFVAAGATFVATAMPDIVKLAGIWTLTAIFYLCGMLLYDSEKLKAAGTAFLGTSLGIIPFAGVTLHQFTDMSGGMVWCVTSLIGLVAYLFAALRLQSQTVAYLTMASVVSLAASLGESAGLPLVWSFVPMIGVSLAASIVGALRPAWVPRIFTEPIERTGQLVTPLALLASLVLIERMSLLGYEVLFAIATLHYAVVWLQTRAYMYETITRILLHGTLALVLWDVVGEGVLFGGGLILLATLQQVYSIARWRMPSDMVSRGELMWVVVMQVLQFAFLQLLIGEENSATYIAWALVVIGVTSLGVTLRFRIAALATAGAIASVLLPVICAYVVFDLAYGAEILAVWFVAGAAALVAARAWFAKKRSHAVRVFLEICMYVYAVIGVLHGFSLQEVPHGLLLMAVAAVLWAGSYAANRPYVTIAGNVLGVMAVVTVLRLAKLDIEWGMLWTAWLAGVALYVGYAVMALRGNDEVRTTGLLYSAWGVVGFAAAIGMLAGSVEAPVALTVIVTALTVAVEGKRRRQDDFVEASVYIATAGLLYAISAAAPELNFVFYAHWFAAVIAGVALWRNKFTTRFAVAMGLVTFSSALYALSSGGAYQLLFLVEHLVLLVIGALTGAAWATRWGLVASCLAVMYFLKDFAFLALGFLGLVLIGIVIWKLSVAKK